MTSRIANTPISTFSQTVSLVDLAWAAGFMDGEGCISIARQTYTDPTRRDTFRLRVDITQNHLKVLRYFEKAVGVQGRLYEVKRTGSQNRDGYHLGYDGDRGFDVIERLLPFLQRKQHEAEAVLEFRKTCELNRHFGPKGCPERIWKLRERFYRKLQALK